MVENKENSCEISTAAICFTEISLLRKKIFPFYQAFIRQNYGVKILEKNGVHFMTDKGHMRHLLSQHFYRSRRLDLGCPGVKQPCFSLVGGRYLKVRRALDKIDLQRLRVAGCKSIAANFRKQVWRCAHDVEQVLALHAHLGHTGKQCPCVGVAG